MNVSAWIMAARPRTLPAAAAPVLVGSAVAAAQYHLMPLAALAALAAALLIQIGTNFANDVFDFLKGADTADRLGPPRAVQMGLLTPGQVFAGMAIAFGLATLIGVYLASVGGWPIVLIGVLSLLAGIAYTGGPYPLGYNGLGDLFVFLFFGLAAVCGTSYVQTGAVTPLAVGCAVPVGCLATAILVVNNLRDIETDRATGKRTLAVRLGAAGTQAEYGLLLACSYLLPLLLWLAGLASPWVLLIWLSAPLAFRLFGVIRQAQGRALNPVLGKTAQLELLYCLLLSAGLLLGRTPLGR